MITNQNKINFIINIRQQKIVSFLDYINPNNKDLIKFVKEEYSNMSIEELNIEYAYYNEYIKQYKIIQFKFL
tara:strand:+ start:468 stop:683 length:216 start_codon:yes stop_codon:yes gene_type:complete